MKRVAGLLALVSAAAMAQGTPPPSMLGAVSMSMQRVCAVNQDSRQCEILQDLFADQIAIEQGRKPELKPEVSAADKAEYRKAIRRAVAEEQARQR